MTRTRNNPFVTLRRLFLCLTLLLGCLTLSAAQSLDAYLKMRRQHSIRQAVGVESLQTLVGSRVVEIQGRVKGSFRVNGKASILLEREDGSTEMIEANSVPDWLEGNDVPARLIVRASRADENAPLRTLMLGAAPEDQIRQIESRERAVAARTRPTTPRRSTATNSRGSRPAAPQQDWNLPASEATPYYAAFIKRRNPRLTDAKAMKIAEAIVGFSLKYGVDARLIMAMVMVESGFNPSATSHKGAMGLGQLMPGTARWMGVSNAYDTHQNLSGTVRLVRFHLNDYKRQTRGDDFQSLVLAVAAYNAGMGAVRRHGGVPPYRETQRYVQKVIRQYYEFIGR